MVKIGLSVMLGSLALALIGMFLLAVIERQKVRDVLNWTVATALSVMIAALFGVLIALMWAEM